jgi:ATP-dependent protease ClpP protease subunit
MAPKPKPKRSGKPKKSGDAAKEAPRARSRARNGAGSLARVAEREARDFFEGLAGHEFYGPKLQHVYLHGPVTDEALEILDAAIQEANSSPDSHPRPGKPDPPPRFEPRPIAVHINSPGGLVGAGTGMRAVLSRSSVPVCTVIEGQAASAATFVSIFAPYRVMCEDATALIHQGSGFLGSTISGLAEQLREFGHVEEALNRDYVRRTKISPSQLEEMNLRDLSLGSARCLELGIVDRVIDPTSDARVPRSLSMEQASRKGGLNQVVVRARYPRPRRHGHGDGGRGEEGVLEACIDCVRLSSAPRAGTASLRHVVFRPTQDAPETVSDAVALANHVRAIPVATFLLVDQSFMPLMAVLPLLPCSHRVMYSHASLSVDGRVFVPRGAHLLEDVVENTRTQYDQIRSFLSRYTKTPASVVEGLKSSYTFLTAAECLRYGIVDEVVDA